jgi:DNA-directed RNA polymerase specialized sigma24 family protein
VTIDVSGMREFRASGEIASRLQITQNAVKLRLLRAHRALRRQLAERGWIITNR